MYESPGDPRCGGTEGCEQLGRRAAVASADLLLPMAGDWGCPAALAPAESGVTEQSLSRAESNAIQAAGVCVYVICMCVHV